MTHYATCRGCVDEKRDCPTRTRVRDQLRGLGVTSLKWRCKERTPRFTVGSPVWVQTVDDHENPEFDDYGRGPQMYLFPGIVVRDKGSKALVYIADGAVSECECVGFSGGPFCKIPLSRLTIRQGEREDVCRYCEQPASAGHAADYSCNPDWLRSRA